MRGAGGGCAGVLSAEEGEGKKKKKKRKKKKRGWESKVASIVEPNPRGAEDHTGSGAWGRRQLRAKMADTLRSATSAPALRPRGPPGGTESGPGAAGGTKGWERGCAPG